MIKNFHHKLSLVVPNPKHHSFSLVEALTSVTVLVIILMLLMYFFEPASKLINASQGRIESTRAALNILDAFGIDINSMVNKHGATMSVCIHPVTGEPNISFLTTSRVPSSPGNPLDSRMVSVFYGTVLQSVDTLGFQPSPTIQMVCRGFDTVSWSAGNSAFTALPSLTLQRGISGGSGMDVWDQMWEGAFRMEYVFIHSNGTLSPNPDPNGPPQFPRNLTSFNPRTLKGIIVGLVVLDTRSLKILLKIRGANGTAELAQAFPPVTTKNTTPSQAWSNLTFPSQIPVSVLGGIRIFERTYLIPE